MNDIEPRPGRFRVTVALVQVLLGALYVLNPGAGLFELIPDNLPLFGNLDEAAATALFLDGARTLWRRYRRSAQQRKPVE